MKKTAKAGKRRGAALTVRQRPAQAAPTSARAQDLGDRRLQLLLAGGQGR